MVGDAALGAVFGLGFTMLYDAVKDVRSKVVKFKSILEILESTLDNLAPVVRDINQLNEKLDKNKKETDRLIEVMKEGKELVDKCLEIREWKWNWKYCYKAYCYSSKLRRLDNDIFKFCNVNLQLQIARNGLQTLQKVSSIEESVVLLREKIIQEPTPTPVVSCAARAPPKFAVGLDIPMKELKTLLLKKEVQLLLVTAPGAGGCGKTTLVQMLCQDEQIKGTPFLFFSFAEIELLFE